MHWGLIDCIAACFNFNYIMDVWTQEYNSKRTEFIRYRFTRANSKLARANIQFIPVPMALTGPETLHSFPKGYLAINL